MATYGDQQPQVAQPQMVQPQVAQPPPAGLVQGQTNVVPNSNVSMTLQMVEYAARGLSSLFTLIASAVMGSANQKINVSDTYSETLETVTIKFSSYSALQYFVAANAIVLFWSIVSLVMSILFKSKIPTLKLVISALDLIAISLLLTGNGAACALSSQFDDIDDIFSFKACETYNGFCSKVKASIAFSFFAVFMYLLLIGLSLAQKKN